MKSSHSKHYRRATPTVNKKQPRPLILALMLTGVLALEADPTFLQSAFFQTQGVLSHSITIAQNHFSSSQGESQPLWKTTQNATPISPVTPTYRVLPNPLFNLKGQLPKTIPVVFKTTSLNPQWVQNSADAVKILPPPVDAKVRETVAKQSGIAAKDLKIVEARQQTWPDTCLGLATAEELCGQMLVPGWRVVVSDGRQTWVYRTDFQGRTIRLESQSSSFIPSLRVQFLKIPGDDFLSPWTKTLVAHLPISCQVSNFVNLSMGQSCSN